MSDGGHQSEGQTTPGSPNPSYIGRSAGCQRDLVQLSRLTAQSRHGPGLNGQRIALIESLLLRMEPDQSPVLRGMLLNDLGLAQTDSSGGHRVSNL